MYESATVAASANFLIDRVDFVQDHHLHFAPEVVIGHGLELTRSLVMRSGYGLWEFTVQMLHQSP